MTETKEHTSTHVISCQVVKKSSTVEVDRGPGAGAKGLLEWSEKASLRLEQRLECTEQRSQTNVWEELSRPRE